VESTTGSSRRLSFSSHESLRAEGTKRMQCAVCMFAVYIRPEQRKGMMMTQIELRQGLASSATPLP
jgi:hypothetical protein